MLNVCLTHFCMEDSMEENKTKTYLPLIFILGGVWGLSEAALGMGLRACASNISGSLMTGFALLFLTAGWTVSRRVAPIILLVVLASLIKMFDAVLLSLPIKHGAVANPIFAFFMEGLAFLLIITLFGKKLTSKTSGKALMGGGSALIAVGLFPLVGYATGISACIKAGTGIPLSIYYAPLAIIVSFITVPLGFWLGSTMEAFSSRLLTQHQSWKFQFLFPSVSVALSLAVIVFIRLI